MHHRIAVAVPGQPDAEVPLDRPATAGGSHADAIHLAGLPPGALGLEPVEAGVVATARIGGARAAGHPLPPGARRLLRPGERVELQGASFGPLAGPPPEGTRLLAAALLAQAAAGEVPIAGLHLVVLTGPSAGARLPLGPEEILGRGRAATLRIADPRASRRHVRLRVAGGVTVEDLGSKNGLRVNGVAAERGPRPLQAGDELAIGDTLLALADPDVERGAPPSAPRDPNPTSPSPPLARGRGPAQVAVALLGLAAAIALAGL
jgi:hypothetical protein